MALSDKYPWCLDDAKLLEALVWHKEIVSHKVTAVLLSATGHTIEGVFLSHHSTQLKYIEEELQRRRINYEP